MAITPLDPCGFFILWRILMNLKTKILIICLLFTCIHPVFADEVKKETHLIGQISDRISLSGAIELDYSYADDKDTSDNTINRPTSDLDIGTVELGLEAVIHDYVTANLLLKGEALDSDSIIYFDKAFVTIQKQGFPAYFIGGKRAQPFGSFESLFINDSVTQDLYEINKTGATIGFTPNTMGLYVSATVYKGETLIQRLSDTGYGFGRDNSPGYQITDDISSYIFNILISPMDGLSFSTYFDSEPGNGERNTTLGGSVHWEFAKFIIDGEYIGALNREKHYTDDTEYKEAAWFASIGFQIIDPLILAVRYEDFNDGKSGNQAEHMDHRYSFGVTYTIFEQDTFVCNLLGEYRKTEFEYEAGSSADKGLNEFFVRLAIEF